MRAVIASIGDDSLLDATGKPGPVEGVHGSSQQRVRWFERGLQSGSLQACDTFSAANL